MVADGILGPFLTILLNFGRFLTICKWVQLIRLRDPGWSIFVQKVFLSILSGKWRVIIYKNIQICASLEDDYKSYVKMQHWFCTFWPFCTDEKRQQVLRWCAKIKILGLRLQRRTLLDAKFYSGTSLGKVMGAPITFCSQGSKR